MQDEIKVNGLHSPEMIKEEMREMLGTGDILVTLGMIEGLWLLDSPYIKGGNVTENDLDVAKKVCCAEDGADPIKFHEALVKAIDASCRPFELIVPDSDITKEQKHSEIATFSPEWMSDQISMACMAMPSLTYRQILWEVPMTMITHLAVSTARRHGAITRRPSDVQGALEAFKKMRENDESGKQD